MDASGNSHLTPDGRMRLCVMVEGQEDVRWEQWLALAQACERAGVDALFRSDHYLSTDGRIGRGSLDAWATLAGLAAHTAQIRLGTMVSPVTFRHPSVLAMSATTVDHISGGRVEVGVGAGWYELEHTAFGFPFPPLGTRMEMLEEQVEIVIRQWTEDEFSYHGGHYQLDRCPALPRPLQRPHPPVIVGGGGKRRTVALAARFAQEYNVFSADVEECRRLRARLDRACEAVGRDPSTLALSATMTTLVSTDDDGLDRRADDLAALIAGDRTGQQLLSDHREEWMVGTVDQVGERLQRLAAAGVQRAVLQHLNHADTAMVDLIGSELVGRIATT